MAMSRYNRENPFMYLLEQKESELTYATADLIRDFIRQCILVSVMVLGMLIYTIIYKNPMSILHIALHCFFIVMLYRNILNIGRNIKSKEVNKMIFGDDYKEINLNNERLLSEINNYNVSIGKVSNAREMIAIYRVVCSIDIALTYSMIMCSFFM